MKKKIVTCFFYYLSKLNALPLKYKPTSTRTMYNTYKTYTVNAHNQRVRGSNSRHLLKRLSFTEKTDVCVTNTRLNDIRWKSTSSNKILLLQV